ncbi:hypothetical protein HK100_005018 [Physocladia obscura]|uniref:Uncharacterized protein n=1 Tax=Physocladia obscura TaxID=109957 RepID=A0AAD5SUQ4_9FUNG|nr:hypothetical protein HK100_005018 [Physocladia obscura]
MTETTVKFAVAIMEAEILGGEIHKDYLVDVSQGSFALTKLMAQIKVSKEELPNLNMYLGLINDEKIHFESLSPRYDEKLV